MLESFCAAANLKAFLLRGNNIPVVKQCAMLVDQTSELFAPDNNFPEARTNPNQGSNTCKKSQQLHQDIRAALQENEDHWKSCISGWTSPDRATIHRRQNVGGFDFTTYAESRSLGSVFFRPNDSEVWVPGRIQEIFSVVSPGQNGVTREHFFCAIKRYQGQPIPYDDSMLSKFEDFGAQLWSSELSHHLDIITLNYPLCHMIGRPWSQGIVVLKPTDRVSIRLMMLMAKYSRLRQAFGRRGL